METVSMFLGGVKIDGYFGMDMQVVAPVVDAIGGVWFDVDLDSKSYNFTPRFQLVDTYMVDGWFMNKNGISYWKPDLGYVERITNSIWGGQHENRD